MFSQTRPLPALYRISRRLCRCLSIHPTLSSLSPSCVGRTQAEGPLRACPKLRKLSLARCGAGSAAGEHLAAAVSAAGVSVDTLDLSVRLFPSPLCCAFLFLCACRENQKREGMVEWSSVPTIAFRRPLPPLQGNSLGDAGATALAEALRDASSGPALSLDLTSNGAPCYTGRNGKGWDWDGIEMPYSAAPLLPLNPAAHL